MARRDVVEITCDRCGRTETQTTTEMPKTTGAELEATFHGEKVCFNDLCKRCREAVSGYYTRMVKKADDQIPPAPKPTEPEKKPPAGGVNEGAKLDQKKHGFFGGGK